MLCTRDIFFRKKCVFCTLFECKHDVARDLHFSLAIVSEIQTHSHSHTNERKKRQESITHRCTHRRELLALTQTFGEGTKGKGGKNTKCNDTNRIQRNNNGHTMASSNGICCFSFYFSLAVCAISVCLQLLWLLILLARSLMHGYTRSILIENFSNIFIFSAVLAHVSE